MSPATVTVQVTAEDIAAGVAGACQSCPVWHAVHRIWPGLQLAVSSRRIEVGDGTEIGAGTFADLPAEARIFISMFDAMLTVEPFSFAIEVLAEHAPAVTS